MDPIGTQIASTAAGTPEAKRAANKRLRKQAVPTRRIHDETDISGDIEDVETPEAMRRLTGNSQEDAREDREEQGFYDASGEQHAQHDSSLDIEG